MITELEDLRINLHEIGSGKKDNQFMIYILNHLTSDYELPLALMAKASLFPLIRLDMS
jgi:hypothetical protein